jgi:hypothetical protein
MPTIYRAMKQTEDGLPVVGSNSKELGVRVPPNSNPDIDLGENGHVILNGKGMSVAANWRALLPHLIPKRLKPVVRNAAGSNSLACFRFGQGPFFSGALNAQLSLVLKVHETLAGNVVPTQSTPERQFQLELAATQRE